MTKIIDLRRNPRILVLEDNRGDFILLQRAFKSLNMDVDFTVAGTGEDAIALLSQQGTGTPPFLPDLILVDLNLPAMSGHDFLKIIKTDEHLHHIPVLILSSSSDDADVFESYESHANGHMAKPVDLEGYDAIAKGILGCWFGLMHLPPEKRPLRRFG